jgi:hypothetical protein
MPVLKINDQLYSNNIVFIYDELDDFIIKYFNKNTDYDASEICSRSMGFFVNIPEHGYYIVVTDKCINWLGTLAHECMHLTSQMLRKRGIPLSDDSEEAYAYYLQWLFNVCGLAAVKSKKKSKKKVNK